jgi:hypothetical protein
MRKKRCERRIFAQGDLDGACFLYGLANAVLCFTGDNDPVRERWSKLTGKIGRAKEFLNWESGTIFNKEYPKRDVVMARKYLKVLTDDAKFRVTLVSRSAAKSALKEHVRADSILLFDNGEHWSCIVEINRGRAYIACSAELASGSSEYSEELSVQFERPWNVSVRVDSLTFERAIMLERTD